MYDLLFTFIVAFAITLALTPVIIKGANKYGFIVKPSDGRWHHRPTALMGGIALFCSFLFSVLIFMEGWHFNYILFILCCALMFLVGLRDDLKPLRPKVKFGLQVLVSIVTVGAGFYVETGLGLFFDVCLSVLWIVGMMNAVNLIDNMDGFSSGIAFISSMIVFGLVSQTGHHFLIVTSLAIAGVTAGFLIFNFKPAKIFMGDCGSLFLGYALATLTMHVQSVLHIAPSLLGAFYIPVFVMAVPLFDTFLVMIDRKMNGRSIAQGGKDHSSHRLFYLTGSERKAILLLYSLGIFFGATAIVGFFTSYFVQYVMVIVAATIGLMIGYFLIKHAPVYKPVEDTSVEESGYGESNVNV